MEISFEFCKRVLWQDVVVKPSIEIAVKTCQRARLTAVITCLATNVKLSKTFHL
jgi:hypothetical protein